MEISHKTSDKSGLFENDRVFNVLCLSNRNFIKEKSKQFFLTFQDIKNLVLIAADLEMWDEGLLSAIWPCVDGNTRTGKSLKQFIIQNIFEKWNNLKTGLKDYENFNKTDSPKQKTVYIETDKEDIIIGSCPVASEKTCCCNLLTLDAVKSCVFDCSYCSIQSFYGSGKVFFHKNLKEKLNRIIIDPEKQYHIGTGQSSDSLMWGNKNGLLEALFLFAESHQNIILELKTKSANIDYFLQNNVPRNIIVTWSLNPDTIIKNEEHHTASLNKRLDAAKMLADIGIIVGFHFHPIVYYKGWENDYHAIYTTIQDRFDPEQIAMVSFGTLTFIKPVIQQLRRRLLKSKILQMPLEDAEGKFSYPVEIKLKLFTHAYNSFRKWHDKVFFYLCMEDKKLWPSVFGRGYESNNDFEADMIQSYFSKILRAHPEQL